MDKNLELVEAKDTFRSEIKERVSKYGRVTRVTKEMGISRRSLYQFLEKGTVRRQTLNAIVIRFAGENAAPEDYIKKI